MAAPARLVPTTAMPMTAPPRKPAMKEGARPFLAARGALTLAIVETLMPTQPASPDRTEPRDIGYRHQDVDLGWLWVPDRFGQENNDQDSDDRDETGQQLVLGSQEGIGACADPAADLGEVAFCGRQLFDPAVKIGGDDKRQE